MNTIESIKAGLGNLFRAKPPSILYKYCSPERIDVLKNGCLRFSQPPVFNDPFESSPAFLNLADRKTMERASKIEGARTGMPEEYRQHMLDGLFSESGDQARKAVAGLLLEILGRGVGVLSLTAKPDNLLMWAHYAKSHEGFVIGFKTNDPFLSRPGARRDAANDLRRVIYSAQRPKPQFLANVGLIEMYFTKSKNWEYEEEWRMFTSLPEEDSRDAIIASVANIAQFGSPGSSQPYPVRLFDFPAACVERIIVGCRATDETQNTISEIAAAKYPHAKLLKAVISPTDFKLELKELSAVPSGQQ